MKKCPTCDKEFPDSMRFCQTDGTVLIGDAPADPYKTVVGNQSDIAAAIPPLDPFKTMVASSPAKPEEDILQLPEEPDQMKTMVIPPVETKEKLSSGGSEDAPLDLPPAQYAPSAPLIEPKPPAASFNDAPNNFGGSTENAPSPFDSKPFQNDFSSQSPYGNQENKPIPSPFQDSLPPGYQPPSASPFDAPNPPSFQEAEPMFGGSQTDAPGSSAFQPPTPFGEPESYSPAIQDSAWQPPPAPMSGWQNQEIGANTPFQPPAAGIGQNQTLAVVSLILGILSFICGGIFLSIPAIITGYIQKNNIKKNPSEYTGGTMATIGMVIGVVNVVLTIVIAIVYVILIISASR